MGRCEVLWVVASRCWLVLWFLAGGCGFFLRFYWMLVVFVDSLMMVLGGFGSL